MRLRAFISDAIFLQGFRQLSWLLMMIATCTAAHLPAQDGPTPAPQNGAPYVLHLYARLVELPTMILVREQKKHITLEPQQINIRLNAGQPFHPTSVRPEGNDPLSIAVLLDVSGDRADQLAALQKYFAEWVSSSLRPQDHVSLYALDCDLIETAHNMQANSAALQKSLDLALTTPLTHGTFAKPACGNSIRLRGSILLVMNKLAQLPGRRTLLIVTGGRDGKSKVSWPRIDEQATLCSVTVFAITSPESAQDQRIADVYNLVQQSGGFLFSPPAAALPNTLNEIVSLLRTRYILQFPEPEKTDSLIYRVFITVPKFDAVIRPSSITVPVPDPILDHPSTDLPSAVPDPPPPAPALPTITPNR